MSGAAGPSRPLPLLTDELPMQPLIDRVLADLQQRLGANLDEQVRAAMAPALARAMEQVVHETRLALNRTLHEQVHQAVQRALAERAPP